jgi:hypothetical protein
LVLKKEREREQERKTKRERKKEREREKERKKERREAGVTLTNPKVIITSTNPSLLPVN